MRRPDRGVAPFRKRPYKGKTNPHSPHHISRSVSEIYGARCDQDCISQINAQECRPAPTAKVTLPPVSFYTLFTIRSFGILIGPDNPMCLITHYTYQLTITYEFRY